ncbi:MAG: glycosyltransferase [Chloroflexota bacterium]
MNIGLLLPGFSAQSDDWAIPVQQNLARELATSEDVRVIALRYPFQRTPYSLDGARVYPLGAGSTVRGFRRLRLWWDALRLIARLHREQPFDVLHAMWADETGLIAVWAGRRLGIPVVVSILGGELVGLRDIGYGLQRSRFSRWVVGQALRAERVIVPSSTVRRLIDSAGYRVPEEKIVSITLGVDAERFKPVTPSGDPYRLIHVASLIPIKDQGTLLRALALLDRRIRLDVIGVGTEQANLEALARALGISEQVNFMGAVAHPDLPGYYQRAAVKVLSSRHETIAMAILEAAACGLPTVSTAVGIVPDYPALGVTVPVGDATALARAIQALIDDPQRRESLSKSARASAESELSIQQTKTRLISLYSSLIRHNRAGVRQP